MKIKVVGLLVAGIVALAAAPSFAQTDALSVNTKITVKAKPSRLKGKVVAPVSTGATGTRCEKKRVIQVFMKKNGTFKRIARVRSAADGSWSARATRERTVYKIRMKAKDFTFTTSYGTLQDVACLAKTVKGKKVTGSRFKIL